MTIGLFLLAAVQASAPLVDPQQPVTSRVAAERAAQCGAGPVTVRSDTQLDIDVLVMAATVTDDQLACIDKAASYYDVELPPAVQPRLNSIRDARAAAMMAQEGRKWLAARHLLDRVPDYRPELTDDAAFTRRIEALCGARGAFQSRYGDRYVNVGVAEAQMICGALP